MCVLPLCANLRRDVKFFAICPCYFHLRNSSSFDICPLGLQIMSDVDKKIWRQNPRQKPDAVHNVSNQITMLGIVPLMRATVGNPKRP